MTTIAYKPGASGPFVVIFEDLSGSALEYPEAELRISTGAACLAVAGTKITVVSNGAEVPAFSFDLPDLPPRLYTASPYYDAGEGWRSPHDFHILYRGGC